MTRHFSKSWLKAAVGLGMISIIAAAAPAHVVMSSQQDRQRVMDQLKITLFPSGPGPISHRPTMRTPRIRIRTYPIL